MGVVTGLADLAGLTQAPDIGDARFRDGCVMICVNCNAAESAGRTAWTDHSFRDATMSRKEEQDGGNIDAGMKACLFAGQFPWQTNEFSIAALGEDYFTVARPIRQSDRRIVREHHQ
jgi:hypothetical protein